MKQNLKIEIIKLWEQKNYDEASELILRASPTLIKELVQTLELKLLSGQALAYVLEILPLKDWGLNETLKFNQNNTPIIIPILQKKYQDEFDLANLDTKIKMFKEARDNYTILWVSADDFLIKNWQHLVHLIANLEIGIKVHDALFMPQPQNLWSAVAALKTIKVAIRKLSVIETENLYLTLRQNFKDDLSDPIRVMMAEAILKKMEQ